MFNVGLTGQASPLFSNYTPEKNKLSSVEYADLSAKSPAYEFYNIVETKSISKMLSDGKAIDLTIPQRDSQTQYLLVEELNLDKTNLFLRGRIAGDDNSLVTIRSEKDMLYGTIRKGNQSFTITGIKPGVSVISQNKLRTNTPYCPLDGSLFNSARNTTFVSPYDFSKPGNQKKALCPEIRLNILVMFTTAAEQSVPDIEQTARNSVDQMNGFLHNSGLDLRANLVGTVAFPEFVEGAEIIDDLGRLGGNISALPGVELSDPVLVEIVQEQITLTGADYVVFLTETREDGIIGLADATVNGIDDFELGPPNRLAIVAAEAATEEFTFGHEVGHLMGCHHQAEEIIECNHGESINGAFFVFHRGSSFSYLVVPDESGPEFAHALLDDRCRTFLGKNKAKVSVMFSNAALDGPPILREQKWNVDYLPAYSNQNDDEEDNELPDNARRIREVTAEVLALGDCTPGVNVSINQFPLIVEPGQTYSFGGNASDCDGTPFYTWEISTDGVNFVSAATGSSANLTMPAGLQPFATVFVRLSVRCDDGDGQPLNDLRAEDLVGILILTDDCQGFDCLGGGNEPGGQVNAKTLAVHSKKIAVSPNPAINQIVINFGTDIERFEVLSGNGSKVTQNWHTVNKDHQITINISAYHPGLYLIRGYTPEGTVTAKFMKQ